MVVHDVPLLVELRYEDRYHLTVVVHADEDERVRRLVEERGSTEDDARRRVAAQADDGARRRAADVWLDNTGAPDAVLDEVDRLWTERLVPFERGVRTGTVAAAARPLVLAEPDPTWEATGERLAARVARAAGDAAVRVDHVGSTSVPGLPAKDVVDLQLVVADLAAADAVADRLGAAGFPRREGGWADTPKPGAAGAWEKRLHGSADPGAAGPPARAGRGVAGRPVRAAVPGLAAGRAGGAGRVRRPQARPRRRARGARGLRRGQGAVVHRRGVAADAGVGRADGVGLAGLRRVGSRLRAVPRRVRGCAAARTVPGSHGWRLCPPLSLVSNTCTRARC